MTRETARTWAEISLGNLEHNYRALRSCAPDSKFLATVTLPHPGGDPRQQLRGGDGQHRLPLPPPLDGKGKVKHLVPQSKSW